MIITLQLCSFRDLSTSKTEVNQILKYTVFSVFVVNLIKENTKLLENCFIVVSMATNDVMRECYRSYHLDALWKKSTQL
jgi:hypothetical protein